MNVPKSPNSPHKSDDRSASTLNGAPLEDARPQGARRSDAMPHADGSPGSPPPASTSRGPRRSGPARWWPWALAAVLLIAFMAYRARQSRVETAPGGGGPGAAGGPGGGGGRGAQDNVVPTVLVTVGNFTQTLPVTGTLRANQNIDLNSKISGRVARVTVQEGARVRRGQLLVALDDEDLRAAVDAARAGVRTAQARLGQSQVGLPARVQEVDTGIRQAEAGVATAQARYQQALLNEPIQRTTAEGQVEAARDAVRTARTRLTQARATSGQTDKQTVAEVQAAESAVRAAQSAVERQRATLAEVERGSRDQQIAQAEAAVRVAEAQLRDAETDLNRQRTLFQGGAAPRAQVDAAQTRYDVANAQLESARQNLSLVREGATTEQVRQAQENLRSAEEGVRQSQALLAQAQAGRGRATVAQNEVTAALAGLGTAQTNLQTALANLSQIPITRQETLAARQAVDQARAQLASARANRSQIPIAQGDISVARAAVTTAQSQLQQAQVNLNYARIYSPIDGVITQKLTDVGEAASPGVALLSIVSLDRVYFEAQVSQNNLARIRVGQPTQVTVDSVSNRPLNGFVSDIIPVADARLRQFRVRVALPEAPGQLTPGAFARGIITTQRVNNALLVPQQALQYNNGAPIALVAVGPLEKATVKRRGIRVGPTVNGRTQILGGLQKGDRLIVDNPALEDGDIIRVAKSAPATTATPAATAAAGD